MSGRFRRWAGGVRRQQVTVEGVATGDGDARPCLATGTGTGTGLLASSHLVGLAGLGQSVASAAS